MFGPLLSIIVAVIAVASAAENIRLSRNIVPVSYVLNIDTFLHNESDSKFSGHVKINVQCMNATNEIVLHARNLEIIADEIEIEELAIANKSRNRRVRFEQDNVRELIRLQSIDEKRTGFETNKNYSISLKFRGNLTSNLVGYYLSSYRDERSGQIEYLAVTHFEPTDARRAFPCFDEPDFKATFQINLRHHKDFVALSNMPLSEQPKADLSGNSDYVWSRFEPSVKMSTYLVAYCLSKFVKRTAYSKSGTEINVWSRKSVANQTQLAVDFAAKSLDYYENFFHIDYPLKKSDLIALPDFSSGAMENWGLITFREKYLTLDNAHVRIRAKFNGYSVIAHELAHQWFGNLVTMKWWSDLWLNEGFATFMADLAVESIVPEWAIFDSELVISILTILDVDYLNSSHPVQAVINSPSEINEIFDYITYQKGSFVLQQLYSFLGANTFRNGISSYLREHQYANAEQDDLWRAFDRQIASETATPSQFSIKQIMDTWTKQNGFPLITIERLPNNTLVLDQMKFSYDLENEDNGKSCWFVPLTFHFASEPYNKSKIPNRWLNCLPTANKKLAINDFQMQLQNNAWYTINNEFAYLAIVNYDRRNWELLKDVLMSDKRTDLSELNRVHLVTSAFSLANANLLSYEFVFDMMKFLTNEDSFIVLKTAFLLISDLEIKFLRTDFEDQFNGYLKTILVPLYEKYGGIERNVSSGSYQDIQKWFTITSQACKLNIGNCTDNAVKLFETQKYQTEAESLVYNSVIMAGDSGVWNRFFKLLANVNDSNRRSTLLAALGKSTNTTILNEYMKNIVAENSVIRRQDHFEVFNAVVTNRYGFETAKNFFYENIARLETINAATPTRLGSLLGEIVYRLNSHTEIEKMNQFIDDNSKKHFAKTTQAVDKARELLKYSSHWLKRNSIELQNYLSKHV